MILVMVGMAGEVKPRNVQDFYGSQSLKVLAIFPPTVGKLLLLQQFFAIYSDLLCNPTIK